MDQKGAITVVLTDTARDVIARVRERRGHDLALVIGNGCCDSTAPFLFSHYYAGPNEREVVVDAIEGDPQPDSFSCEAELGYRFTLDRLPAVQ